jgi:hypothetical protein
MRDQEEKSCGSSQLHFSLVVVSATWMNSLIRIRFLPVEGYSHPFCSQFHRWRSNYGELSNFRVFASAARCRAFPPVIVLSWNWSLVQSIAPATYRPHWFCEPTTPLAAAPVLWVSVTNAVGGRFRSPDSNLSASSTFLQSLDHPTLAAPPQRDSASHELSRPSAHPDHRVHYDGSCLPAGSAFRVWLPS